MLKHTGNAVVDNSLLYPKVDNLSPTTNTDAGERKNDKKKCWNRLSLLIIESYMYVVSTRIFIIIEVVNVMKHFSLIIVSDEENVISSVNYDKGRTNKTDRGRSCTI